MVAISEQLDELIQSFSHKHGVTEEITTKFVVEVLKSGLDYLDHKSFQMDSCKLKPSAEKCLIKETEEYWLIEFRGKQGFVAKSKGMKYITLLLQNPCKSFNLIELMQMAGEQIIQDFNADIDLSLNNFGTFDPIMDKKYITDIKRQMESLDPDFDQKEIYALKKFLIDACASGGRVRGFRNDSMERERKRIGNAIHRAIDKLKNECPELSIHLLNSIQCGNNLTYIPEVPLAWNIFLM